ncbi:MAG: ribosome recycling factor [Campylobacteraceae bacterium]|jgi:ribosome recycling factor|nr:ribosome recycling factor [Campylobacteraceae bacterium]MBT3882189.1 ribosome recycling factor [Campylobacteraceae bacterium]MBT4031160.1 ribosome recycling factor [Campylobacteraceae bacterium]MBT4179042.1 ribosome recycling factor [Campylobacteraceae bacterium]MBT4572574.1 ribosome recycling factor [Campylobacteraceae bacterium]
MVNEIFNTTKEAMDGAIDALKRDYGTLRTGKVNPSILDNITIDYYGSQTGLSQVATILAPDATTINITPWEKHLVGDIEKAISAANIGVNPNNNGESVQLFFPPMTVEQRQESAKGAKGMTDNAKVSMRNIRKSANDKIKKLLKDKEITEDESKKAQDDIQKITDTFVAKADDTFKAKEAEVLKV